MHEVGLLALTGVGPVCEHPVCDTTYFEDDDDDAVSLFDDISGAPLPADLVKKGRAEELDIIDTLSVWVECPLQECWDTTGAKPVPARWLDVDKGDETNWDIR